MQLPSFLVDLIDPAGRYMRRGTPRRSGPGFRGGSVWGPGVPGGARQATDEELEAMRQQMELHRQVRDVRNPPQVDSAVMSAAAHQVIEQGRTLMQADGYALSARVVRFWHGESLLEIDVTGPGMTSSSQSKVRRTLGAEDLPVITQYLRSAFGSS